MTSRPPVIVFVPHQDDELLIMGPAIRNAAAAGRQLRLVLFGQGDGTAVRRRDMPALLGREPSGAEIGAVRDDEFRESCRLLGVAANEVVLPRQRQPEKTFTRDASRTVMIRELEQRPDAEVWTVSEFDANPDHAALGLAARDLVESGDMADDRTRLFVAPWCKGTLPHPPLHTERADIGYREQRPYRYTDIDAGLWGVGYKSVRDYFNRQLTEPACYSYNL